MTLSSALRTASAAVILALVCVATACAAEPDAGGANQAGSSETAPDEVLEILDDALSGPDADGDGERAFGSSDDAVITAVESTFKSKNARAEWVGSTLRVSMDGSAEAPTATIPCLALEGIIADGEDATIAYSDGDVICADRFDTD